MIRVGRKAALVAGLQGCRKIGGAIRRAIPTAVRAYIAAPILVGLFSCATLPASKYKAYDFPEQGVFVEEKPARRYKVLGPVRVRVNYSSLNPEREEQDLCRNYYNKGVNDLLKRAKRDQRGDAVIDIRSVVYFMDGKQKRFATPECSDDGQEGQILLEGKAIRYLKEPKKKAAASSE